MNGKQWKKPLIIGNWKMHKTVEQACQFLENVAPRVGESQATVCIAAPFTVLDTLSKLLKTLNASIILGAQNMNDATPGAFTGEIAASMLKDVGATFVLLGHSERRHIFKEDDSFINRKVLRALEEGLVPVLCVGETLQERENDKTFEVITRQIEEGLKEVNFSSGKIIIAYEPVWAIGTGNVSLAADAESIHSYIRGIAQDLGAEFLILYGGSVKPSNCAELLSQTNIDGLLIGGASLEQEDFLQIIQASESI